MERIFVLLTVFFCKIGVSQVTLTQAGLRDNSNTENSFIVVQCPDKTAKDLYNNAIKYINKLYKNPDKVILGQIENEYLRFETYVAQISSFRYALINYNIRCKYSIELTFKEGKYKYEVISLEMEVTLGSNDPNPGKFLVSSNGLTAFSVYKDNGKLLRPEVKRDIEAYFNREISNIRTFLNEAVKNDW